MKETLIWLKNKNLSLKFDGDAFKIDGFIRKDKWISFNGKTSEVDAVMEDLKKIDKILQK